jgi:Glu-tRNA(Gln) amidotransferase subunit E-like FAD-binding protein
VAGDRRRGSRPRRDGERRREHARRGRSGRRRRVAEGAREARRRARIPRTAFDQAIAKVGEPGFSADPYLAEEAVSDTAELEPIVAKIIDANPKEVEAYRGGKEGLLGFFVGQVMRETQGKADPRVVNELVRRLLAG